MRRISTLLGTAALAAVMAVAVPGSAQAATGDLQVGFAVHHNPSGCYNSDIFPLIVGNETNETATVYDQPDCQGNVIGTVAPGQNSVFEFGASVSVP